MLRIGVVMYQTSLSKGQELVAQRMVKEFRSQNYDAFLITSPFHDGEPVVSEEEIAKHGGAVYLFDERLGIPVIRVSSISTTWPPRRVSLTDFVGTLGQIVDSQKLNVLIVHSTLWNGPEDVLKFVEWRRNLAKDGFPELTPIFCHMSHFQEASPDRYDMVERTYREAWNTTSLAQVVKGADLVLVVSPYEKQVMTELGAEESKCFLFPGGIEELRDGQENPESFERKNGIPVGSTVVTSLGTVEERKNTKAVVKVAKRLADRPDIHFVIAGLEPGEYAADVRREATGLGNVSMLGPVSEEDKSALIRATRVNIILSRSEALGIAQLEFMANGVPVVSSGIGGQNWLVRNGENGFVVEGPDDIEGAAGAVAKIADNASLRRKLGANARRRASAYSMGRLIHNLAKRLGTMAQERADEEKLRLGLPEEEEVLEAMVSGGTRVIVTNRRLMVREDRSGREPISVSLKEINAVSKTTRYPWYVLGLGGVATMGLLVAFERSASFAFMESLFRLTPVASVAGLFPAVFGVGVTVFLFIFLRRSGYWVLTKSDKVATPADSFSSTYTCGGTPTIQPIIGITGTPVIDPSTSTLYVVALNAGSGMVLFAINANSGKVLWSQTITASGFNYVPEEQRGALALANGFVYIPFGSYSWACTPAFGWLFAISANGNGTTFSHQVETQAEGDIWAPEGVTVDSSGNVYVTTGDANNYNATYNYADSVLKFSPQLKLIDSFAPSDWATIGPNDLDLGTTGYTLLSGNLGIVVGKDGMGYLLNNSRLGGIGGQLFASQVCRSPAEGWPYGAWGSISFYNDVIYVPCNSGMIALELHLGSHPTFSSLWNYTGIDAGPAIIAAGAVWMLSTPSGELYALNPTTGSLLYHTGLSAVQHFVTPSAGDGRVFVAANATVYAIDVAPSVSGSSVTVDSQNTAGQTLTGYRVVLYDASGTIISKGYTPVTFPTSSGLVYQLAADSYGSCTFSKWSDGATANPRTFTASGSPVTFVAVYSCTSTTSSVTVDSVDQTGATITGYYTVLSSGGSVVATGFTPKTFTTNVGQAYTVSASSYGSCTFSKWSDGVTSDPRSFTATTVALAYTAVYNCVIPSKATVNSVDQNGNPISGYRVALYSSGGTLLQGGYTTTTFNTESGSSYKVLADSYGSCTFNHWSTTGMGGELSFTATATAQTFTAVYECT